MKTENFFISHIFLKNLITKIFQFLTNIHKRHRRPFSCILDSSKYPLPSASSHLSRNKGTYIFDADSLPFFSRFFEATHRNGSRIYRKFLPFSFVLPENQLLGMNMRRKRKRNFKKLGFFDLLTIMNQK